MEKKRRTKWSISVSFPFHAVTSSREKKYIRVVGKKGRSEAWVKKKLKELLLL